MTQAGFFELLFKQIVALLSAFCIVPSNGPATVAANFGPPGSPSRKSSSMWAPTLRQWQGKNRLSRGWFKLRSTVCWEIGASDWP